MALIHVFNGIETKTTFAFTGKIRDHVQGMDWNNTVILKGGYKLDPNYTVKENDIIYIRKIPTSGVEIAAIIALGVSLIAGGVAIGISIYNNKKAMAELENAQKAAKAARDNSAKLPYIKGARNQAATGQTFPFIIGKSLFTPYRLCTPHYTIDGPRGENQYFNIVLECGYNDILFNNIKMGETPIKDFSGDTQPQDGVYSWDPGTYYDENNLIEIKQRGNFETENFNKKIILQEISEEIPHDHASTDHDENVQIEKIWRAGIVQPAADNAQAVELIVLFDGMQKLDDQGNWLPVQTKLKPQWTNVDNPQESDWVNFTNGFIQNDKVSNTFTYNTKNQMRYRAVQEFTPDQTLNKKIKVRIIRETPKEESTAKDRVYLLAVQTTCYDAKKSSNDELITAQPLEPADAAKCCRLGLRVHANINTKDLIDAFNFVACGVARVWDGEKWTADKVPTRNIAAWALEILTSDKHGPSRYDDSELDLESFGAWFEYCERENFYADGVITKSTRKKQTLETLCRNSNTTLFYNNFTGKMEAATDNGREYPIALLNKENIINISTVREFKRKTDGRKVSYINGAAGYDADTVKFMRDGEEYDPATDTLTELALELVTTHEHAFKIAWRDMATESAQPITATVKAGLESAYYPLYSRVDLQHPALNKNKAHGVIKSVLWQNHKLKKIILDGFVVFPEDKACGIIINCASDTGHGVLALRVDGSGRTNELEIIDDVDINDPIKPESGNGLSFGELDANGEFKEIVSQMKIINTEETDDGFNLTLVNYVPELYNYGPIPKYKTNLTTIPNSNAQTVEDQRPYITDDEAQADAATAANAAVDTITTGAKYTSVFKIKNPEYTLEEIIRKLDEDARNTSASISISENEILLQVEDTARELIGLIDIQAGAINALVAGGGATGQLSLSIELPATINEETRAAMIEASTAEKVNNVYGKVENTSYYAIKKNASSAAIKLLWDDAVAAGLLASQIALAADHIYIDGDVIVNDQNKIKAAMLEVENILTNNISVKDHGVIKSENYNGVIDENGVITEYGDAGWAVDHTGKSDFVNINATGGTFKDMEIENARYNIKNNIDVTFRLNNQDQKNYALDKIFELIDSVDAKYRAGEIYLGTICIIKKDFAARSVQALSTSSFSYNKTADTKEIKTSRGVFVYGGSSMSSQNDIIFLKLITTGAGTMRELEVYFDNQLIDTINYNSSTKDIEYSLSLNI
ncbi:MAG: hypothetical protein MJ168_10845 [Clostridia bacterium]|nr:hypothetical protein [Clostridia bacterium]